MVKLAIWTLGGTIAMVPSQGEEGVTPKLDGISLLAALEGFVPDEIEISVSSKAQVGSANLSIPFLVQLAADIKNAAEDAIVITQGTDTLEESSFLLSLLVGDAKTVVMTGAMRPATSLSADGPANLCDALHVAKKMEMKAILPKGVYVVMNAEVHDPAFVSKSHTSALHAFQSVGGPVAAISEGDVHVKGHSRPLPVIDLPLDFEVPKVRLVSLSLDDDPAWVEAAAIGCDGLVIEAYGAGHVPEAWADLLGDLARKMPVILSSRAGRGRVFTKTYAYKGAEIDLLARGLVPAGLLCGRRSRLGLMVSLVAERSGSTNAWQDVFKRLATQTVVPVV